MPLTFNKSLVLGKKAVYDSDAFTPVNSPSITTDGILTPASSKYVTFTGVDLTAAQTWKIKGSFIAVNPIPASTVGVILTQTNTLGVQIIASGYTHAYYFQGSLNGNSWTWTNSNIPVSTFIDNTKYYYEIEFTGEAYNYNISTDNQSFNTISSYTSSSPLASLNSNCIYAIGSSQNASRNWYKDIDLKDFKIIADGQEVFAGLNLIQPDWQTQPFKFDVASIN